MHMQSVTSRITDQDLKQVLDKTDLLLDECITESQSLSHHLSPPILDKMGLLPALAWLAEEQEDKHGLAVVLSYDEGIEPVDPVVAAILFHAVRELLFNIVKHAKVKQAEVHVTSADQRISIEVRDAGVGFDPSIAGDKAGALGLHSIRERLRLFGGELEMIATPGKGARAILHAPLGEVGAAVQPQAMRLRVSSVMARTGDPALRSSETGAGPARKREPIKRKIESTRVARRPAADRSSVHREAESASAERRVRILLVDDHPLTRSFLTEMLSPYNGIEVVGEASDGAEAVTAAMRLKPDVVLMDVSMPQLNGIEATRRIVAQLQNVRVIGISLHETEFMAEAMREAGAIDYFRKNEPVAVLLEKILRHMNV
jgi:CheY-like chemotaxis protein